MVDEDQCLIIQEPAPCIKTDVLVYFSSTEVVRKRAFLLTVSWQGQAQAPWLALASPANAGVKRAEA